MLTKLLAGLLMTGILSIVSCTTRVVVTDGKITVTGIPDGVEAVTLTLETERSIVTFQEDVRDGRVGLIDLGPRFAGLTYEPGQIRLSTFDSGGNETRYENSQSIEITRSTEEQEIPQEIPLDNFREVS